MCSNRQKEVLIWIKRATAPQIPPPALKLQYLRPSVAWIRVHWPPAMGRLLKDLLRRFKKAMNFQEKEPVHGFIIIIFGVQ